MKLEELIKYTNYNVPAIEFYNEYGDLEYVVNLNEFEFDDIDVIYGRWFEPYGIVKLQRKYEKTRFNDKGIQPTES
tara:strand:+ start:523 stop:750 length:228 start_codon:yes stop_codon:yes gene_type:complete